jgi:hypothetical protein
VARILVAGDEARRGTLAKRLEGLGLAAVDDAAPAVGDVVMFIRVEGARYDAIVFVGHADPVTRGALAVAERAVLLPLVSATAEIDGVYDGYLYRLPRVLGFRDEHEREMVLRVIPKAADVPSELVGPDLDDEAALRRLVAAATQ